MARMSGVPRPAEPARQTLYAREAARSPGRLSVVRADEPCRCCAQAGRPVHVLDVRSTDAPDTFAIERCESCGVLRTTPAPADLAPYYATDLAATMTRHESRLFSAVRRVQLGREVRRITRHGDPGTVVDVGGGAGDFALAAAAHGLRAVVADASPDAASLLTPSLYRCLRVRGWPPWLYERFGPTGALATLAAPFDRLLGGNVLWAVARRKGD